MTTITFGGLRPASSRRPDKAGIPFAGVLRQAGEAWRLWQAERALEALDDRTLHDIGVARADIRHAVRTGQRG